MPSIENQSGQVLLIVVLVMVVALTVGLSVVSRTIIDLQTAKEEESSARAFSAAEAGVERALKSGVDINSPSVGSDTNTSYTANVTAIAGSQVAINGGNFVPKDEGVDIWLSDYPTFANPSSGNFFSVYFGAPTDSCSTNPENAPALEVIVLSGDIAQPQNIQSKRYVFDPCPNRRASNNFSDTDSGSYTTAGVTFPFRTPLGGVARIILDNALLARVIPIYKLSPIGIYACNNGGNNCINLPTQGKRIESTGKSGLTQRKVVYYQGYDSLMSEFFQYGIFSTQ